MSETSPLVHVTPLDKELNGSCGLLVPNTYAKIVDLNTGEPVGPNTRGELCVKGPQVLTLQILSPHCPF
jgi:long-subunit acyl-CoA synthetase (AMP-forming)